MVVQKKRMPEYQHNLLGVGVAPTEVEKLVPNSVTRTAMCFTIGFCSYTRLCACLWPKSIAPSGSTKALGLSHTSGWIHSSGRRPPATLRRTYTSWWTTRSSGRPWKTCGSGLMWSWCVRMRRTNSGASSTAQHLLGPISSAMIWQLSRSKRATWFSIARRMWAWAFWISPSTWCTISITTSSKRTTERAASFSARALTAFSLRSRPRMCRRTWPRTKPSMTHPTTPRTILCTAQPTRKFWESWKTSAPAEQSQSMLACAQICTQSLRLA